MKFTSQISSRTILSLCCCASMSALAGATAAPAAAATDDDSLKMDHRYAPPSWQTAICLPDDWQKTLVSKDGSLLYDYPGNQSGFGLRLRLEIGGSGDATFVNQRLLSPRVPIVRTTQRSGDLEIVQEAFALAPPMKVRSRHGKFALERVGTQSGQAGWAAPPASADPAFRDVAIGWNEPIQFRFRAEKNRSYTVAFGLCEGYHEKPGQRVLTLSAEGSQPGTVDMVAEHGRNRPEIYFARAVDQNQDGWIDLIVSATPESRDKNTILNTLWVFAGTNTPAREELISATASSASFLAHINCSLEQASDHAPRHDLLRVRVRNTGSADSRISPRVRVDRDSTTPLKPEHDIRVRIGANTALECSLPVERIEHSANHDVVHLQALSVPAGKEQMICLAIARGNLDGAEPLELSRVDDYQRKAERYWRDLPLPYNRLQVPDAGVQALIDSSIRNIYQAREIKKGLPAFQVGPTCYRGLWVVDGSFLLEAVTYLGRANETRKGVEYLMSFQRKDGGFMLMDGHWKETGIALWAISRHAQLTGDKAWLKSVWTNVRHGFEFIRQMRQMPAADAPNARLIPDGFSDGGLADKVPEYTNIYWTMAGMRAAIASARWLGEAADAESWEKEYEDFLQTFRRAAERDLKKDAAGNAYLPIRMKKGEGIPPQKAQWAFLQGLFPGKVFTADDTLVQGNMSMLKAVECQGLVRDTGWLKDGIWTYFGSFYAHAWLWLGEGEKSAHTLYAFGNHASPLLAWREEQMPVGQGQQIVGDMPHNWASAEFIRLVRHSLVLERGSELHLLEGLPASWLKPGAVLNVREIATEFGPVSLEYKISADGSRANIYVAPPKRTKPMRIVLHAQRWSGKDQDVAPGAPSKTEVPVKWARP